MAQTNQGQKAKTVHSSFLLRAAFILLLISMFATYVSDQMAISSKRQQLAAVRTQVEQQQQLNEELARVLEGDDDEINERVARDVYGYAAPNERVFIDMSGR